MKRLFAILALVSVSSVARADLLLEPYVGYFMGNSEISGGYEEDFSGLSLGGRVGFQSFGFMLGGDFMTGKWEDDGNPSMDVTPTNLGVFVGYNFPILLRVYGIYGFSSKLKHETTNYSNTYEGDSIRLGVGFTGLPFISINLEYFTAEYDEDDFGAQNPSLESSGYGLTVSLPLTF